MKNNYRKLVKKNNLKFLLVGVTALCSAFIPNSELETPPPNTTVTNHTLKEHAGSEKLPTTALKQTALNGAILLDTCDDPTEITLLDVTDATASIGWTGSGVSGETYEYAYVIGGEAAPASGTVANTATASLTGLLANTTYDFYVRTDCGSGDVSSWAGPFAFTTNCGLVTTFNEGFEDVDEYGMADCWTVINGGGSEQWEVYESTTYSHTGGKAARILWNTSAHNDYLITPGFTVTDHLNDYFSFWVRKTTTSGSDQIEVLLSTTGTEEADFNVTLESAYGLSTTYEELTYDLSAYEGQTVYVAVKAISTNQYTIYLDDIRTYAEPTCFPVENVAMSNITVDDVTFTWDATPEASYQYSVGYPGEAEPVNWMTTTQNTVTIPGLGFETEYLFYVRNNCDTDGVSEAETVAFETPIGCLPVTNFSLDFIATNEGTISWIAGGTELEWEYANIVNGDPEPTSGTVIEANSVTLSNLNPGTDYILYVRANCAGVYGYSEWETFNYATECVALDAINEDFEGGAIPACWTVINEGDSNTWYWSGTAANAHSGSGHMRIDYSFSSAHNDYLVTPEFTVIDQQSDYITFWAKNYSASSADQFDVLVSTTGNEEADFTEVLATDVTPGTSYEKFEYSLSAYEGQTIYFALRATSTNEYYLYIDDFLTQAEPTCYPPDNAAAGTITVDDATFTWDATDAGSYEYYAEYATGGGATTVETTTEATATISSLDFETEYVFYLRNNCGADGYSEWVTVEFETPIACEAVSDFSLDAISSDAATISWTAGGTELEWEYANIVDGDAEPTTGTIISASSVSLTSLNPSTDYVLYVRANCGGTYGYSDWETFEYTTTCVPLAGINEGFEGGALPECWTVINGGDNNTWYYSETAANAHTGSGHMRIDYSFSSAHDDYLVTPAFTVVDQVSDYITFWAMNYSASNADQFDVLVSTTGANEADFTEVLATDVTPGTEYERFDYNLSAYEGQTIYFALRATSTNEYYLYVDDFLTQPEPTCYAPDNAVAATVTVDDATFTWDVTDAGSYEYYAEYAAGGGATTVETTNEATATISGLDFDTEYVFYVRNNCGVDGYSEWAEVEFETPVACEAVSDFSLDVISSEAATISWTAGGTELDWEYVNIVDGDPEPTTGTVIGTSSVTLSNLTPATDYVLYVRANCGATYGYSEWETFEYTTACAALTGINESFENGLPECWSIINNGDYEDWFVGTTASNAHTGSGYMAIYYDYWDWDYHDDYLITPPFTVVDQSSDWISFWAMNYYATSADQFDVLVSTTGNSPADFTEVLATDVTPGTSYEEFEYDLSAYEGQTIYFAIRVTSDGYYLYVDDFLTQPAPLCTVPANVAVSGVTTDEITYTWSAVGTATYDYYFTAVATDVPNDTTTPTGNTASTSVTVAGLNASTSYYFYVRSNCGGTDGVSEWTLVLESNTACEAVAGIDEDFEDGSLPACWTVINGGDANTWYYATGTNAYSGSGYVRINYSASQSHDDYLITPAFTVVDQVSDWISFWAMNNDDYYFDQFDVLVSTTGNLATDFTNVLATDVTPGYGYEQFEYDLSAYEGQTIYFALRATSLNEYQLFVDNFVTGGASFATDVINAEAISVFPNPVKNNLYINGVEATSVAVYNMLGQQVSVVLTNNTISMGNLQQGVYLVTVNSENGSQTIRVIKE